MKWEFADLIHLSCHCDSYRQTISLPGVQTGKTGACKWAADGISQVPSHLVFTSQMSSLVAPTLRNYGNLLVFQRQVLSRNSFAIMCEIQPFLFINQLMDDLNSKQDAHRSWWPSQSSALGVMLNITVLPGNLDHASHVLVLIYCQSILCA